MSCWYQISRFRPDIFEAAQKHGARCPPMAVDVPDASYQLPDVCYHVKRLKKISTSYYIVLTRTSRSWQCEHRISFLVPTKLLLLRDYPLY